jgi:hypothetical protein
MSEVISFSAGGYHYVNGVFQYSAGVVADPGYTIERARLDRPVPLLEGFAIIQEHLRTLDRPMQAFCACELRSPAPFNEDGFGAFNSGYVERLRHWGIVRDGRNPIARTNVCPAIGAPGEPSLYAFSYTVPSTNNPRPTFVISGSGEVPEGQGNYRDHVICPGDRSPTGLREKARWVLGEMERRMSAIGFDWHRVTGTHLYTIYDVHPFLADEIVARHATPGGLTWHFARPPVKDLDYEMDVRAIARECIV